MSIHFKKIVTAAMMGTAVLLLNGCVYHHPLPIANVGYVNPDSLPAAEGQTSISPIRKAALKQAAVSIGARGALAFRSKHIDQQLSDQERYLDQVFNFNRLLLPNSVLPPVIIEANNNVNMNNGDTIRTSQKVYKIISKAHFVSAVPTWRDYLWMNYQRPDLRTLTMLPTDKQEAAYWNAQFKEGWKEGLQQANDIFSNNLNQLKRDYLGMLLYRKLLAQGMISSPQVAKADLGITGNENELRIHDEVSRITAHSTMQRNTKKWKPILTP